MAQSEDPRTSPARPAAAGRTAAALFLALLGALALLKMVQQVDNDLFWQIKEGELVVREHRFPVQEEFSFTSPGIPMVAPEWGAEAASYLLFRLGGYPALVVFNAALFVAAFALLFALLRRRQPPLESLCLLALVAFAFLNHYAVRAQNWSFLFTALFLYWTALWEDGWERAPWAMAAALLPWANLHGGFMVGWAVLALLCLRRAWESRRPAALGPLLLGTLLCCAHPNGAAGLLYPLWFVATPPPGTRLVQEWRPVDFTDKTTAPALLLLAFLLWTGLADKGRRFPWALLTLALTVLALRSRKLLPAFTLAAVAALSFRIEPKRMRTALCGAAALALGVTGWVVLNRPWPRPFWDWEHGYPRAAAELIAERYPGRRVFHEYDWGGYLIYKLHPDTRVFIDGRFHPYAGVLTDYLDMVALKPGWDSLFARYGIDLVLLRPTAPLCAVLARSPVWTVVHADDNSVLLAHGRRTAR